MVAIFCFVSSPFVSVVTSVVCSVVGAVSCVSFPESVVLLVFVSLGLFEVLLVVVASGGFVASGVPSVTCVVASGVTSVTCVAAVGVVSFDSFVLFGVPVAMISCVGLHGVVISVGVGVGVPSVVDGVPAVVVLVSVIVFSLAVVFGFTPFPFLAALPASRFFCFAASLSFGLAMFALLGATLL